MNLQAGAFIKPALKKKIQQKEAQHKSKVDPL
jgi:hypothetical protein